MAQRLDLEATTSKPQQLTALQERRARVPSSREVVLETSAIVAIHGWNRLGVGSRGVARTCQPAHARAAETLR